MRLLFVLFFLELLDSQKKIFLSLSCYVCTAYSMNIFKQFSPNL